jgi:catechol 2,3-dioxygenase-like lactoylglutathione lyase family enzyme
MSTEIAGIVFRSKDKERLTRFYSDLGLSISEHQHGGPKHYEVTPLSDSGVLEIYSASQLLSQDALMLYVDSLSETLSIVARGYKINQECEIKETPDSLFVYIKDPDGRLVMLIQKK